MKTKLKQISVLVQLALHVPRMEVEGFECTQAKIIACYVAKKTKEFTDEDISDFFREHPSVVELMLKQMAINYLCYEDHRFIIDTVFEAYMQIEKYNVKQ